jgi:hypoxanthine phosphoribosyltransferase
MKRVTLNDKTFEVTMPEAQIKERVKEVAQQMSREL